MSGFEQHSTEVLLLTRERLLAGLDKVAASLDADTFRKPPPGKDTPPSEFGPLFRIFLEQVDAELARREGATP